jgi:hypothetical protein
MAYNDTQKTGPGNNLINGQRYTKVIPAVHKRFSVRHALLMTFYGDDVFPFLSILLVPVAHMMISMDEKSCLAVGGPAQVPVGGQDGQPQQHGDQHQQARGREGAHRRNKHPLRHIKILRDYNSNVFVTFQIALTSNCCGIVTIK